MYFMFSPDYNHYISSLTQNMKTLNVKDPIDLWESWNDHGKLHIGYCVCVDMCTFSIYGAEIEGEHHSIIRDCIHLIPRTNILQLDSNVMKFWINYRKKFLLASKPNDY